MNWLRKAPTPVLVAVVVVGGLLPLAAIGGFVALEINGADTAEYRGFLNLLMNGLILALSGAGAVGGISAARSASNAEDQTNGQLTSLQAELKAVRGREQALRQRLADRGDI